MAKRFTNHKTFLFSDWNNIFRIFKNLKLKAKQAEQDATNTNIFHLNVSTQQIFTSYKNLVSYRRWKVFQSIKDLLGCKNEIIDLCQSNKQNKSPFKTFQ